MSKLHATQEQPFRSWRISACRAALFTPILLITVLAGCASKGERASALDHSSSGGRGYNASAAHANGSSSLNADSGGQSSAKGGVTGKRKKLGRSSGGVLGGPEMNPSSSADGSDTFAEGEGVDGDSSFTDDGPGADGSGKPGSRGRNARKGGRAIAGGAGTSGDGATEGGLSGNGSVAGVDGRPGKGKRGTGGRRRGANGAPGSGDEGDAMGVDEDSDTQIAAVEVANGKVEVNEEYQPLTLGGALPVVLGVNEEGRFDFDQYALRDEVKAILDGLAQTLKTAEYDRLEIFGYADRIGAVDYNRRLSELRAYAVAQYLMHRGVPEHKIRYEGRGDRNPLTQVDECQGLSREELITCLQKDRRVEIEASIHRKHATVVQ